MVTFITTSKKMELIKEFNQTGICILNIEEVVKQWNNMFVIYGWINDTEEKYTFAINELNQEKPSTKAIISKEQAFELIEKLYLIKEKTSIFRSACSWHKKEYYHFEIERLNKLIAEKSKDIEMQDALIRAKEIIVEYLRLV